MAINSDDELFHRYLYDWHVNRGLAEQLLEVSFRPARSLGLFKADWISLTRHISRPTSRSRQHTRAKSTRISCGSTTLGEKSICRLPGRCMTSPLVISELPASATRNEALQLTKQSTHVAE